MAFKIGDKVRMKDDHKAEGFGVRGEVGEVTAIVKDGTSLQRVTVKFPGVDPIEGMVAGAFELA